MWGHREKVATYKPSWETSGETNPADTLILDFQLPELWENKFLLFKAPNSWYLAMAALAVEHNGEMKSAILAHVSLQGMNSMDSRQWLVDLLGF